MKTMWLLTAVVVMNLFCGCAATGPKGKSGTLSDQAFQAIKAENYDKARELLEEALQVNPKNAYAWLNLGVVHQKQERYEDAKACYLKVVEHAWDEQGGNKEADGRSLVRIARENLEKIPE